MTAPVAIRFSQTDRGEPRIRIALTAPANRDDLRAVLVPLRQLLDCGPAGYDSYA